MKVVLTPPFIDLRFLIGVSVCSSCLEGDMDIAKIVCVCLFISFVIFWVLGGIFLTVYVTKDDKMETRNEASAIQINPNQALIIGGFDENYNDLKTTELISSSGSEEGKDFPVRIYRHCSFPFNATHGIVTGGTQAHFANNIHLESHLSQ